MPKEKVTRGKGKKAEGGKKKKGTHAICDCFHCQII